MRDGKVNTLVVIGGNPVFNAPADLNFRSELQKVATKIRLGLFHDQTSEACDWHLPLSHPLESWGDTETSDGTLCCVQPLIAPLNGAKTAGAPTPNPHRAADAALLEVLALLTAFPNPADGKPVDVVPRSAEGRLRPVRKVFARRSGIAADGPKSSTPSSTATSNSASCRTPTRTRTARTDEDTSEIAATPKSSKRFRASARAAHRRRTPSKSPSTRTTRSSTAGSR